MAYEPEVTPPPPNRRSGRHRDRTGLWVWVVVLMISGFIVWIAFTWSGGNFRAQTVNRNNDEYAGASIGNKNQPGTTANPAANPAAPARITSVAQFDHTAEARLAGAQVDLPDAKVTQTGGAGAFLIQAGSNQVLVVPRSAQKVNAGQTVSIQGMVQKLPTKPQAMYDFKLTGGEATWAEKTGIYISATAVTQGQ